MQNQFYAQFAPAVVAELGIENLTRLGVDLVALYTPLSKALGDGFQGSDLFVILSQYGIIQDIGKIAPQAFKEIGDLTPDEADQLEAAISEQAKLPNDGTVLGKFKTTLALTAETYEVADDAKKVLHKWRNLFQSNKIEG